jgi:hypothetical protein
MRNETSFSGFSLSKAREKGKGEKGRVSSPFQLKRTPQHYSLARDGYIESTTVFVQTM